MSMAPRPPQPPQQPHAPHPAAPPVGPPPMPPTAPAWSAPGPHHEGAGRAAHEPLREHGEHDTPHHVRGLMLVLALSIAVVSVLGAIVGWRAETHASKASRFEQDAVAASIAKAQLNSEAGVAAAAAEQDYNHYARLGDEAARLDPVGCDNENQQTLSELEAGTACDMQTIFSDYDNSEYIVDGKFDTAKFAADYVAANDIKADTDASTYEARATDERHHEDNMLYLSLGLVLALALLTLARLGKTRASSLLLAVPGWLCLAAGAAVLVVAEM